LIARDGHSLRGVMGISIRAIDRPAELQLLEESLMDGAAAVTLRMVQAHFEQRLRAAAADAVRAAAAEELLADVGRNHLSEILLAAARRIAFASGLEVLPPCQIELDSPSLARQRIEQMQRQAEQQRQAGRLEQFQRTSEM